MSIQVKFIVGDKAPIIAKAESGEKVTQVAYRAGVKIKQSCGGAPSCTDCIVRIDSETNDTAIEAIEHEEKALLGNVYFITRERLACQCVLKQDAIIHVPMPELKNE